MIRLHQTFGAHTGRAVDVDRDVIRFGRLPDNEFAFDPNADLDASGRHAEIRREGAQWVLVDVGSRNGTLLRGQRVTRHVLSSGDEIEFGLGGPRVRVEIVGARAGVPTAQATPVKPGAETAQATPVGHVEPGPARMSPPPSPFAADPRSGTPSEPRAANPAMAMPAMTPLPAPPADRRYGQRTVGMMIQAALQEAEQRSAHGGNRSTAFLRAVAVEAARSTSRGLKVAVALLTLLMVLTLGAVVALFFYARWQEQQLRDENVDLQRQLAALGAGETAERRRLEERIQSLNDRIREQQEQHGARIAESNDGCVYVILARNADRREVICSAFAVRADLLATSARCVGAVERAMGRGHEVSVVPNRGGAAMRVERMWRHPAYVADRPVPSPDVGLVRVDRTLSQPVRLATLAELGELRTGDDVFVYGFPEQIAGAGAPVAGLTTGIIGRMTAFDGTDVDHASRHLLSHSAFTDDGTAGSPLFDRQGRVVALNAGNYRGQTRVVDPRTRLSRTLDTETPYAWAVRVDLLLQLLAGLPSQ